MHESNTTQRLGRTEKVMPRDAAWEEAFLAQLTDDLADSVAAFAKKRASWVGQDQAQGRLSVARAVSGRDHRYVDGRRHVGRTRLRSIFTCGESSAAARQ